MTAAAEILGLAEKVGVQLRAEDGKIIARPRASVNESLVQLIRTNKVILLEALTDVADVAHVARPAGDGREAEARRQRVLHLAWSNPNKKYAVHSDDDTTDPVMVAVAIRKGDSVFTLEVAIPKARYDGMALLDLVEKWAVIKGGKR